MEVILAEGKGVSSKLIKWFTGGSFSHVALRYTGAEKEWMSHSTIGGVQPEWWYWFEKKYKKVARYKCMFAGSEEAADRLIERIGHKKYGYITFIGIGIYILLKKIGINLSGNPFGDPKTYLCTELINEFFKECNAVNPNAGLTQWDSELLDPLTIENYLNNNTEKFNRIKEE